MVQSNNESNVRRILSFWQKHSVDPPIPWEECSDLIQLAINAKENVDIKNLLNRTEKHHAHPPALEIEENESENQRKARTEKNF